MADANSAKAANSAMSALATQLNSVPDKAPRVSQAQARAQLHAQDPDNPGFLLKLPGGHCAKVALSFKNGRAIVGVRSQKLVGNKLKGKRVEQKACLADAGYASKTVNKSSLQAQYNIPAGLNAGKRQILVTLTGGHGGYTQAPLRAPAVAAREA